MNTEADNEIFSKFKDDKNKSYYLLIKWHENNDNYLELTLTDASNTWKLSIAKSILEKKSNLKVFDLEQIQDEINQAFRYKSNSITNYIINITFDESFSIAKVVFF
jgi:hypothetical protein